MTLDATPEKPMRDTRRTQLKDASNRDRRDVNLFTSEDRGAAAITPDRV
jgi:hypothetical protein